MNAQALVNRLIKANESLLRHADRAYRTNDHYAIDQQEWATYWLMVDATVIAFGFTADQAREFIRIATQEA